MSWLRAIRIALVAALAAFGFALHGQSAARWETIPPPHGVVVELSAGTPVERLRRDLQAVAYAKGAARAVSIRHAYSIVFHGAALNVDSSMRASIAALPYVKSIRSDEPVHALAIHRRPSDSMPYIAATRTGSDGRGVTIAVIDTGIDYMHPALGGGFGAGFKVAGGYDFVNDDHDPRDDNGHGTHVAGIIAAECSSMTGLAPGVTLLAYKVLGAYGSGNQSDVIAALERAVDPNGDGDPSDHVAIANLSLGGAGTPDDPQSIAVDAAVAAGVIVCVAAGNEGSSFGILSPGTARSAITVGAAGNDGHVAAFSSRGPCVRNASVKPDVIAPGVNIRSTVPGGGFAMLNGTSVAAPQVAAACARIVAAHGSWTPRQVKSAITMTAVALDGEVMAQGGGVLDAEAAVDAPLVASESHFSFGLDAEQHATWRRSESMTVTNVSSIAKSWQVSADSADPGVTVRATPATVALSPGASALITVSMTIDNDTAGSAPPSYALDGVVTFSADGRSSHFACAAVKASRATLTSDQPEALFFVIASAVPRQPLVTGANSAETYVTAGEYELAILGFDNSSGTPADLSFISATRAIAGDVAIHFTRSDAPLAIALRGCDERSVAISSGNASRYLGRFRIHAPPGNSITGFDVVSGDGLLATSPLHSAFRIKAAELAVDADRNRIVALQYPALEGMDGDVALATGASDTRHLPMRIVSAGGPAWRQLRIDSVVIDPETHDTAATIGLLDSFGSTWNGDLYANEEAEDGEPLAVTIESSDIVIPPLRVRDGRFVSSWARQPSPLLHDSAAGERMTFGDGPVIVVPSVSASGSSLHASMRIAGAAGEQLPRAIDGGIITVYDGDGAPLAQRRAASIDLQLPPAGRQRVGYTTGNLCSGGLPMRATFSADLDGATPAGLTSIGIIDAAARMTTTLRRGEAGALVFTAATVRGESARAWFRGSGTSAWIPLAVVQTNDDSAIAAAPLGIQFRAALDAATRGDGPVDLRISITDVRGNEMLLTLEPAFFVASDPGRRRAVPSH